MADCTLDRWHPVETRPYRGFAFPEENAKYWVFRFSSQPDTHLKLVLRAQFPYARYIAYTLYSLENDQSEGYPVMFNGMIQHIEDVDINPQIGHNNPYSDGVPKDIADRNYEINILQEESGDLLSSNNPPANTLVIPSRKRALALFLRIYLPDAPNDSLGGVALPTITAINELSGEEIACPEPAQDSLSAEDILFTGGFVRDSILLPDDQIFTYRAGNYGLFSNGDCPYLTTPLVRPFYNCGKIAVIRFKAPEFPNTRDGDIFSQEDHVRYFSVCMGDWQLTTTSQCIADEDLKVDENGFVNMVIGPDLLAPENSKWNNLRWGLHANPALIFRQISPKDDFEGSFDKVDIAFDEDSGDADLRYIVENEPEKIASVGIGEYGPVGRYCTIGEFFLNQCGY